MILLRMTSSRCRLRLKSGLSRLVGADNGPLEKQATAPVAPKRTRPVVVETMGRIFEGHFLEVAQWMIKQGWIQPSAKPLNTETQAAIHLQHQLPRLAKSRAKKVLAQKMAFMRAIEEINP
jgi:hypothetical protein